MKRATIKRKCTVGRNIDPASKIQHRRLHGVRDVHKGEIKFLKTSFGKAIAFFTKLCYYIFEWRNGQLAFPTK